jgi:hypothetical protein
MISAKPAEAKTSQSSTPLRTPGAAAGTATAASGDVDGAIMAVQRKRGGQDAAKMLMLRSPDAEQACESVRRNAAVPRISAVG